jgi:hypothetical protein
MTVPSPLYRIPATGADKKKTPPGVNPTAFELPKSPR